jgi:hypothetical protein
MQAVTSTQTAMAARSEDTIRARRSVPAPTAAATQPKTASVSAATVAA